MGHTRSVTLDLFGITRHLAATGTLTLTVPDPATVSDVLIQVLAYASTVSPKISSDLRAALEKSVLATEDDILSPSTLIPDGATLALLPPVAGG